MKFKCTAVQLIDQEEILIEIFSFVGDGEYDFVAPVSKQFDRLYRQFFDTYHLGNPDLAVTDTYHCAIFANAARFEYYQDGPYKIPANDVCQQIASHASLPDLKRVRELGYNWDCGTSEAAAATGKLDILKWAIEEGCPWDVNVCSLAAAGNNHICILKWILLESGNDVNCVPLPSLFVAAAEGGHLKTLQWLYLNYINEFRLDDGTVCKAAVESGSLDVLQWAHHKGFSLDHEAFEAAVTGGSLEILDWLWHNGCQAQDPINPEFEADLFFWPSHDGRIDVLEWLFSKGFQPDFSAWICPAKIGNFAVLECLLEHNCPGNEVVCPTAAGVGTLDVVKWARNHGFPWTNTMPSALIGGHTEIVSWAQAQGCPMPGPEEWLRLLHPHL